MKSSLRRQAISRIAWQAASAWLRLPSATVTALEDVECYRMDKDAFHDILLNRPEIAEYISHALARRRMEYEAARDGLDAEAKESKMGSTQRDIFARISEFFGLGSRAQV